MIWGISNLHQGYQYTNPYTKPWFFIWSLISILHQPLIIHLTVHQASTMPLNLSKLFKFLSQSILILKVHMRSLLIFHCSAKISWNQRILWNFSFFVLQKFREIKECFEISAFFVMVKFREINEFFETLKLLY